MSLEIFWHTIRLTFSRDDISLEPKPDEPSKNELKKRAKAAEKEKKAAEKAAKLAEQQRERAEAEEVLSIFHASRLRLSQPWSTSSERHSSILRWNFMANSP